MEPTTETPQTHFVNRVTPLSKILALVLFIALPIATLYIGYEKGRSNMAPASAGAVQKSAQVEPAPGYTRQTITYEDWLRMSVLLPDHWDGQRSPDYAIDETMWYEPETISGTSFIVTARENTTRTQTPEEYVEFERNSNTEHRSSNIVHDEVIEIDGIPAYLQLATQYDNTIQNAFITFLKDGREVTLIMSFNSFTLENQESLRSIIDSLRFE